MMRFINFLTGFVVGVALGGAAAMLLAPQPGSVTKQRIRSRIEAVREEVRQAAEATRADAQARLAELKAR
jgi:gas vesicle protein